MPAVIAVAITAVLAGAATPAAPAAPPPSFCAPSQCGNGGGCANVVALYFDDYGPSEDPNDYEVGGCWSFARLNPSDNPTFATQCKLNKGAFSINPGGPNMYFDDTHANDSTVQTDVNRCANYGANDYGNGTILAEYMKAGPWTPISSSRGVSHFMAELYDSSNPGDSDSYWTNGDWNPSSSTYAGTVNLTPYLPTSRGDPSPSQFNDIVNLVYTLCEDTATAHPNGNGVISVYSAPGYYLVGTKTTDAGSGESAVVDGMNNCVG